MPAVINPTAQELLTRETIVRDIMEKRVRFCQRVRSVPDLLEYGVCDRCGERRYGISNVTDMSFKCVECRAEEQFPIPDFDAMKPKLDLEDFARI